MKLILRYLLGVLILCIAGFFVGNYLATKKVKTLLAEEKSLSYADLRVNAFAGIMNLEQVKFEDEAKEIQIISITLNVDVIHYLLEKELIIENIDAEGLNLKLTSKSTDTSKKTDKLDNVVIKKVNLENSKIVYFKDDNMIFEALDLNLKANEISWPVDSNFKWLENESLKLKAKSLNYDLDKLHALKSEGFSFQHSKMVFSNFSIVPKFSKKDYINQISSEKDLMDLKTKSLEISGFQLKTIDSLLDFYSKEILMNSSKFSIYRDKTIADDTSFKALYSQSLRELGFKIKIDSLLVRDLNITYQELLDKDRKPGEIKFNSIQAQVSNIHNTLEAEKSEIHLKANAKFTDKSDIYFNYRFVPDNEYFRISTLLKQVEDKSINGFFAPAMRMKLDGKIDKIETSFTGNNTELKGDFTIGYEKLKLDILKKDGSKNNLASLFGNVFMKNKNVDKKLSLENVEREATKSFWNYVWTFHLEGLKKSML